ncbi:MAG: class I SAM-dependent methyltransferase [Candidatus Magnetoovum sp. WYHC-5]|nr:class I SAM-dependent methyltransferase [Candidatus Magnetoovum sp. WYHC-5]
MKAMLNKMFDSAMAMNKANILSLVDSPNNSQCAFLDLGCDDGAWTMEVAKKIATNDVTGLDIVNERIEKAKANGVNAIKGNLNEPLPFADEAFHVIHANQVIEHVANIDLFVSEVRRVLKPGGYVLISTENGSSWHNLFAALMGWQMFSLTNVSNKLSGIGNPLALHRKESDFITLSSWTHKTIFNYLGLKELFEVYGFEKISIKGAGYYPLPAVLGNFDVRHAHFITLKGYKGGLE